MSLLQFNAIRDNNHSIWGTAECDAWSRDFKYTDYLMIHAGHVAKAGLLSKPVSETTYKLLCQAFESQMIEDWNSDILTSEKSDASTKN